LNQTGEPSGKSNLPSEVRLPSTSAATSAGASRTNIICNQSILDFAPFLFSVEMAFRMRITVFGGSLPSDPSGKVNFMNELCELTRVVAPCNMSLAPGGTIWPEAGEVAAMHRPKGKTQPKMANKRVTDVRSQRTFRDGAAAIMLVHTTTRARMRAYGLPKGFPTREPAFSPGLVRRDEERRDGSSSA
jgi:hypothetical protein